MVVMVALAVLAGYAVSCRHQSSDGFYWDRMRDVGMMLQLRYESSVSYVRGGNVPGLSEERRPNLRSLLYANRRADLFSERLVLVV
eukprot:3019109-Amphidinium_carterae.2